METVNFTSNPNGKLFNDRFADIRLGGMPFIQEAEFEAVYRGQFLGTVKIESIKRFRLRELNDADCLLACAKTAFEQAAILNRYYNAGEMLPADLVFYLIIFQYTDRCFETQNILIKEWWGTKSHSNV